MTENPEAPLSPAELLELSNQALIVLDKIRTEALRIYGENVVWRTNFERGITALTVLCKQLEKLL